MVKFVHSASVAQGFTGPDPGLRHGSSSHGEVASHIAQPEALTTIVYNYVLGGFREKKKKKKKKKDWQQMLAQEQS